MDWTMDEFKELKREKLRGIWRSMSQRQKGKLRKRKEKRSILIIVILLLTLMLSHEQNLQVCNKTSSKDRKSIKYEFDISFITSFIRSLFRSSVFRLIHSTCIQLEHLLDWKVQEGLPYKIFSCCWLLGGVPWFSFMCLLILQKAVHLLT